MEKAIEIKRRAQRCILNGDLQGALVEYERLIASGDSDPYHSVLLADLLYKKGDRDAAAARYLDAVNGYEVGALVKNAIAICKKMSRLGLSPEIVLDRLGRLHAADGLATEASLYYVQHAELIASERRYDIAERSLREAFKVCPDNVHVLERLGDLLEKTGKSDAAATVFAEAAVHHDRLGADGDAERCRERAERLHPGAVAEAESAASSVESPTPFTEGLSLERLDRAVQFDDAGHGGTENGSGAEGRPETDPMMSPDAPGNDSGWGEIRLEVPSSIEEAAAPVYDLDSVAPVYELDPGAPAYELEPVAPVYELEPVTPPVRDLDLDPDPVVSAFDLEPAPVNDQPGLRLEARVDEAADAEAASAQLGDLLQEARQLFEQGDHEAAGSTLVRAARTYELGGQLENAAVIYRNLAQAAHSDTQVLLLWHDNCQRRNDLPEAARVACELGDRSLMESDSVQAREWFERARSYDGTNELASRRLERLGAPSENGSAPVGPVAPPVGAAPSGGRTLSRGGMIEISSNRDEPVVVQLGSLIAEFQERIKEQVARDPQSQYDLGMSYREMGLYDEAVQAFEDASATPEFRVRCSEMIGRCLLDRGDFDRAAEIFRATLMLPSIHPDGALDVAFQLGLALEAGGRTTEALQQFERIYVVEQNYPDVAAKIRALRKAQEQG